VDVVASVECTTADEASAAAVLPAVVKVGRALHRSELDGVRLRLADADAVHAAAAELLARSPSVLVSAHLEGIEVAIGGIRDPQFGPVVMVGSGGIWVEVLADRAFAVAPVNLAEARELVAGLRISALLAGGRGKPATDVEALARTVVAVGDLLLARPDVVALDLNPVLVSPDGAIAVDWKIQSTPR
jgi:acetyltransferase